MSNLVDKKDEEKRQTGRRADTTTPVDRNSIIAVPKSAKHKAVPVKVDAPKTRGRHRALPEIVEPVNLAVLAPKASNTSTNTGNTKNTAFITATTGGILLASITAGTTAIAEPTVEPEDLEATDNTATQVLSNEEVKELKAGDIIASKSAKLSVDKPVIKTTKAPLPVPKPVAVEKVAPAPVAAPVTVKKPAPVPLQAIAPVVALGSIWDTLANCESSGNWNINTGNGYYGGLQFSLQTWHGFGGQGNPANATREQQISVARQVLKTQGWAAWPACSARLGLTGFVENMAQVAASSPVVITKKPVQMPVQSAPKHAAIPSNKAAIIAASARGQLGRFQDCTMLATNALAAAGIQHHGWPNSYLGLGRVVTATQAMPGDLIYYANGGMGMAHIAVYVGGGQAIHGGWQGNQTVQFSANVGSGPVYIRV